MSDDAITVHATDDPANIDVGRRRFLVAATSTVGAAGAVGVATPFLASWKPSAKAKAAGAPVAVDVGKIEPGKMIVEEWRGKPVYVLHRTDVQVEDLPGLNADLKDPDSAEADQQPDYVNKINRAIKAKIFVVIGICTHLGCAPKFRPEVGAADLGGDTWKGGFFCPCHGSRFDLAGRVFNGSPASSNLVVPPYRYESDSVIVVGENEGAA